MTPTTFKITIELGNDAMLGQRDVAEKLEHVAAILYDRAAAGISTGPGNTVYDADGNAVGIWGFDRMT